jgi:predicted aminopeptidase
MLMARPISKTEPLKRVHTSRRLMISVRDTARLRSGLLGLCTLLLGLPFLWGCYGTYLFHAAIGEYERIADAIPIEDALKDPSLSDRELAHLKMIGPLKRFAVDRLGLAPTDSYSTALLKPQTSFIYTVSASPKDRLSRVTWWFPVVGRVPYLGFFDLTKARAEGKKLAEQGKDVFIARAEAYSTLGWFEDPLTRNMIDASTVEFVETVLHEMTHSTLYLSSQSQFNETLASVVAKHGTILFLETEFGEKHPWTIEARNELQDERRFSTFLSGVIERLAAVYGEAITYDEKMAKRALVFNDAKKTFELEMDLYRTNRFEPFLHMDLNNASILALGLYHRYFNLLDAILNKNQGDIRETIAFFRNLSKTESDLIKALQRKPG